MLIGVTGAFSYGLRFEIERGPFNMIAMCLCYAAIAIYHHAARHRTLVDRWRVLRENVLRVTMLAAASTALLFVLGPTIFVDFVGGTISKLEVSGPQSYIGTVNHSIKCWVVLWARQAAEQHVLWPIRYQTTVELGLIACVRASA
jgi:hypothetical protein